MADDHEATNELGDASPVGAARLPLAARAHVFCARAEAYGRRLRAVPRQREIAVDDALVRLEDVVPHTAEYSKAKTKKKKQKKSENQTTGVGLNSRENCIRAWEYQMHGSKSVSKNVSKDTLSWPT